MRLNYKNEEGQTVSVELGDQPVTLGRGEQADVVLEDEKASRVHCVLTLEDGIHRLKDLRSRNGTFVNGERIDEVALQAGDRIRIGAVTLYYEQAAPEGPQTVLRGIEREMREGKGYQTLLKEIVADAD